MSLAFVRGIHRWPVNSPHKWSVTRKMFPFDPVIMNYSTQKTAIWNGLSWIIFTSPRFPLSVRDILAGRYLTIVRTDAEEVFYFGFHNNQAHRNATQLVDGLYPRDLLAEIKTSRGAVSLGCQWKYPEIAEKARWDTVEMSYKCTEMYLSNVILALLCCNSRIDIVTPGYIIYHFCNVVI